MKKSLEGRRAAAAATQLRQGWTAARVALTAVAKMAAIGTAEAAPEPPIRPWEQNRRSATACRRCGRWIVALDCLFTACDGPAVVTATGPVAV